MVRRGSRVGVWSMWCVVRVSCCLLAVAATQATTQVRADDVETVSLSEWAKARPRWAEMAHASRTPEWAKETLPKWVLPHLSGYGLKEPLGKPVAGIDRWHAQNFIWHNEETAAYLYGEYSAREVEYRKGTLPTYEKVVEKYAAGLKTDREKAVALLTEAVPNECPHPGTVPYCPLPCAANRAMDDEALLRSGRSWCNEQARVYVRLCQVAGIPARMVFFKAHVAAEFYADGHWSLADPSFYCVFPDPQDGHLMSAAECHQDGPRNRAAAAAYSARFQEVAAYSDEQIYGQRYAHVQDEAKRKAAMARNAERVRDRSRKETPEACLNRFGKWGARDCQFGLLNYPLPPE